MALLPNIYHRALEALGVTEWVTDGAPQNEAEFRQKFHKVVGADASGTSILSNDPADWGFTWETLRAKAAEIQASEGITLLRAERNRRLSETDWWVLPDRTPTAAQLAYRQALRDITNTYSSLDDVVWPEKPE